MTLRWVPGWNGQTEPEAVSYVAAVEAADGQDLEFGVARAINDFVVGCKNDGIWDAIKACCILAGARTLAGALVPLVGTAPTNYNFVSGDYNRETGLVGDGITKHLDSNRNATADPVGSFHLCVYATTANSPGSTLAGDVSGGNPGSSYLLYDTTNYRIRGSNNLTRAAVGTGFIGAVANTNSIAHRASGLTITTAFVPVVAPNSTIGVFANGSGALKSNARLSFCSIGESLDLAKLDTRVSNLMTAIGAAIP